MNKHQKNKLGGQTRTEEQQVEIMRKEILQNKYDDSQDEIFKAKLRKAKNIYLESVYQLYQEINELPNDRAKEWQIDCAIELYNLGDEEDYISYSENGLSYTKDKAGLSKDLIKRLPPPKGRCPY